MFVWLQKLAVLYLFNFDKISNMISEDTRRKKFLIKQFILSI